MSPVLQHRTVFKGERRRGTLILLSDMLEDSEEINALAM